MNVALLVAKIVAFALTNSKAVLASLADSAGMGHLVAKLPGPMPLPRQPDSWTMYCSAGAIVVLISMPAVQSLPTSSENSSAALHGVRRLIPLHWLQWTSFPRLSFRFPGTTWDATMKLTLSDAHALKRWG